MRNWRPRIDAKSLEQDIEASLERLETDYLDAFLLHRDDEQVPVDEIVDMLAEYVARGTVRFVGASNWTSQRLESCDLLRKSRAAPGVSTHY